jgi:hypothetical protein
MRRSKVRVPRRLVTSLPTATLVTKPSSAAARLAVVMPPGGQKLHTLTSGAAEGCGGEPSAHTQEHRQSKPGEWGLTRRPADPPWHQSRRCRPTSAATAAPRLCPVTTRRQPRQSSPRARSMPAWSAGVGCWLGAWSAPVLPSCPPPPAPAWRVPCALSVLRLSAGEMAGEGSGDAAGDGTGELQSWLELCHPSNPADASLALCVFRLMRCCCQRRWRWSGSCQACCRARSFPARGAPVSRVGRIWWAFRSCSTALAAENMPMWAHTPLAHPGCSCVCGGGGGRRGAFEPIRCPNWHSAGLRPT